MTILGLLEFTDDTQRIEVRIKVYSKSGQPIGTSKVFQGCKKELLKSGYELAFIKNLQCKDDYLIFTIDI